MKISVHSNNDVNILGSSFVAVSTRIYVIYLHIYRENFNTAKTDVKSKEKNKQIV